jgi:twitching motility protein PilT
MSQIDNFISMMVQRKFDRAILVNDRPGHLYAGDHEEPGPILPSQKMQQVVQEIVPSHLRPQLGQDGQVQFAYQSPHGVWDITVQRNENHLQLTLTTSSNGGPPQAANAGGAPQAEAANQAMPPSAPSPAPPVEERRRVEMPTAPPPPQVQVVAEAPRGGTRRIQHIDELFHIMKQLDASDLHLSSSELPMMRIQGIMRKLSDYEVNESEYLKTILFAIAPSRNQQQWEEERDTDFAYELQGVARFRCNLFSDRHGIGGVFRLIPSDVLTVEQLNLPKAMVDFCMLSKGLVVVTGPTGSGKSTTLAALIDFINKNREDHIITIEDPVEFVHNNIRCLINQREVHVHTESFKRALRAALREDPDIALVGEMRDLETIQIAIETAETGHLVFGTLHTTTAPSTVDRIIDQFPAAQQAQIRVMLSESLKGVVAQTLLRTKDGKRVAAYEILLCPTAVANLIREGKTFQLPSQMQIGKGQGMLTMNDSILQHVISGRVDPLEGYIKTVDKLGLLQSYEANDIEINFDTTAAQT